ncbi:HesB/YadR/YfhF family protein [Pontibacillus litoralis]|nr:iron-sulfur cluster biosynthesis family protein [Pontibacillus litoralis]
MKLTVQEEAANWYQEELELSPNTSIRFFVRYGGTCGLQPGFSLAIRPGEPRDSIATTTVNAIHFYIEEEDEWYFDQHNVHVYWDEGLQEPAFHYFKEDE